MEPKRGSNVSSGMTVLARCAHLTVAGLLLLLVLGGCARQPRSEAHEQASSAVTSTPSAPPSSSQREVAIVAGGCFWGMEEILREIPGVLTTEVGYAGGRAGVTYREMHDDRTGNAEAVRVVFDPSVLSYETLLRDWFFRMHDPTTPNRQGNDVGPQYRSALFVTSPEQRVVAEQVKAKLDASGAWGRPIVTEILDEGAFTLAEDEHQDYLQKNPGGYTCHYLRDLPQIH